VRSEAGVLRQVLLHRPGVELARVTPRTMHELLFDDVPWLERAQEEHDALAGRLRERGVEVLALESLLAEVLEDERGRGEVLAATLPAVAAGPAAREELAAALAALPAPALARTLIGGITFGESPVGDGGLAARVAGADGFQLAPLPNHVFTRDSSLWIGEQVRVPGARMAVRRREAVHLAAIYRHHPRFAGVEAPGAPGSDGLTVEGGDVLQPAPGRLVVGTGERTRPADVEALAGSLFAAGTSTEVLAVEVPVMRATMHLDTLVSFVDRDGVVAHPSAPGLRAWRIRPGRGRLRIDAAPDLRAGLRALLAAPVEWVQAPADAPEAQREQWSDANNVLAVSPRCVIAYDRNVRTNDRLRAAGVDVLEIPGAELGRGRGGPRCLSCPVAREA
jgi:arginine deiminase